jgi:hypothetical protein
VPVSVPTILGFDFLKNGVGIRRADPGDVVTVTVLAKDPDGYAWADDTGRSLNLPDAPSMQWILPALARSNSLSVQVSNGKGGVAWFSRWIQSGPNAIFFSGHAFNRQTNAGVAGTTVSLNGSTTTTDAGGNFQISVPHASRFVLNITQPGFALASLILTNQVLGVQVPLDPVQTATVNGATGGSISVPPGSGGGACSCACKGAGDGERFRVLVEIPDTRIDIRHGEEREKGAGAAQNCPAPTGGASSAANLSITFQPGSFVTSAGATYTGTVSVEAFQYDLTQPNPIPGDFGAVYQGKTVRLGTFGAFHLLPRDARGQPLAMAAGKQASASMPIQSGQLAVAPATIPLFHYDEGSGNWLEDGTLTRSADRYVGQVAHFSVFNADTTFPGGARVKVLLSGFTMPVTLNGTYYDPSVGSFHHPNVQTSETTIGIERLVPNVNFTLNVTDSRKPTPAVVNVPLNSGPGLSMSLYPSGYDTLPSPPNPPNTLDLTFAACNGPVQIANNTVPATEPLFLTPAPGGTFTVDPATTANVSSATYNSTTGVLALTFATAPFGAGVGATQNGIVVAVSGLAGTGNATKLNGSWPIASTASSGTVVNVQSTTGLGAITVTGSTGVLSEAAGPLNTRSGWKTKYGFTASSAPAAGQQCAQPNSGEACAIYFNNGDLKFGRDMHCLVFNTSTGATACYVSNFGDAGHDDAPTAVASALAYEAAAQSTSSSVTQPTATVTMTYDPVSSDPISGVQFWAYGSNGASLTSATLDSQLGKPIPAICLGCHQGSYSVGPGNLAVGAQLLPFDMDSFLDGAGTSGNPFPTDKTTAFVTSQQTSFHALNNMIAALAQAQSPPCRRSPS